MKKENLLTEEDLLVLSACTGELFLKDLNKIHQFIEKTLGRQIALYEFSLQKTYDNCKYILDDRYLAVLNKMVAQSQEAA